MQSIEVPSVQNLVPSQGDLNSHLSSNAEYRKQLESLRKGIQDVSTSNVDAVAARTHFDAALSTGRRSDVVRALLFLGSREEFASLRADIEQARSNIGGPIDSTVVAGEQATRYMANGATNFANTTYQNLPSWMRLPLLGTALGGIGNLALAPVQGLLWLVTAKGLAEKVGTLRKYLFVGGAGLGVAAGVVKGGVDMYNQGTIGALRPERTPFTALDRESATVNSVRNNTVLGALSGVQWLPSNQIVIPAIPGLPITEMRFQLSNADGSGATNLADPGALIDTTRLRTIDMAGRTETRIIIRYKLLNESTFHEPPFTFNKP